MSPLFQQMLSKTCTIIRARYAHLQNNYELVQYGAIISWCIGSAVNICEFINIDWSRQIMAGKKPAQCFYFSINYAFYKNVVKNNKEINNICMVSGKNPPCSFQVCFDDKRKFILCMYIDMHKNDEHRSRRVKDV